MKLRPDYKYQTQFQSNDPNRTFIYYSDKSLGATIILNVELDYDDDGPFLSFFPSTLPFPTGKYWEDKLSRLSKNSQTIKENVEINYKTIRFNGRDWNWLDEYIDKDKDFLLLGGRLTSEPMPENDRSVFQKIKNFIPKIPNPFGKKTTTATEFTPGPVSGPNNVSGLSEGGRRRKTRKPKRRSNHRRRQTRRN
jgi:hypothetical protein